MRLYLLPISTSRTLLYAQRLNVSTTEKTNLIDRAVDIAARNWTKWEKQEKGWQRTVTDYGNKALRRIPYEEWGLKSVPPLSKRRRAEELTGKDKVELVFPASKMPAEKAMSVLRTLATERHSLHRSRLIWCIVGMPLSAPFTLVPVIPNLPFFYLLYRAWSHWRAVQGGQHVKWLLDNKLVKEQPSKLLDDLYAQDSPPFDGSAAAKEQLLLSHKQIDNFTEKLEMPAVAAELDRAIWQVETSLEEKAAKESQQTLQSTSSDEKAPPPSEKNKQV
jgi:hypothetical protein